jgi:hypothetical protein
MKCGAEWRREMSIKAKLSQPIFSHDLQILLIEQLSGERIITGLNPGTACINQPPRRRFSEYKILLMQTAY